MRSHFADSKNIKDKVGDTANLFFRLNIRFY